MINYFGKFIPNLSQITSPMCELLRKEVIYKIDIPQIEAIKKLKELVTSASVLQFYDSNLPLRLRTDASSEGLGAMIEQRENARYPIAFVSRSLT